MALNLKIDVILRVLTTMDKVLDFVINFLTNMDKSNA